MIERGTIEQINGRGRVTVRLADRVVVADLHSGSGGSIGDLVEGVMDPGLQSWRNVGNSILSVVQVVSIQSAVHPTPEARSTERPSPPLDSRRTLGTPMASAAQNSNRKFS
jgi:hypothetical protein